MTPGSRPSGCPVLCGEASGVHSVEEGCCCWICRRAAPQTWFPTSRFIRRRRYFYPFPGQGGHRLISNCGLVSQGFFILAREEN